MRLECLQEMLAEIAMLKARVDALEGLSRAQAARVDNALGRLSGMAARDVEDDQAAFDKKAYQRERMRKRRAAKKT